jgi:hypothetical protein
VLETPVGTVSPCASGMGPELQGFESEGFESEGFESEGFDPCWNESIWWGDAFPPVAPVPGGTSFSGLLASFSGFFCPFSTGLPCFDGSAWPPFFEDPSFSGDFGFVLEGVLAVLFVIGSAMGR